MTTKEKAQLYAMGHYFYGFNTVEEYTFLSTSSQETLETFFEDGQCSAGIVQDYEDMNLIYLIEEMQNMAESLEEWFKCK